MNLDHLIISGPQRLDYPPAVCVYCGAPGYTKDHLLPKPLTGLALRRYILTVPACGQCNSFIGDLPSASITFRRHTAHEKIARKYWRILEVKDWTTVELRQLGPLLRAGAVKAVADKWAVVQRLDWPTDLSYDLRAFELSGIEDPHSAGLLGMPQIPIQPAERSHP